MSDTTNYCPLCEQAAKERDAAEAEAARHKAAAEALLDDGRYVCAGCPMENGCWSKKLTSVWDKLGCQAKRRKWAYGEEQG